MIFLLEACKSWLTFIPVDNFSLIFSLPSRRASLTALWPRPTGDEGQTLAAVRLLPLIPTVARVRLCAAPVVQQPASKLLHALL